MLYAETLDLTQKQLQAIDILWKALGGRRRQVLGACPLERIVDRRPLTRGMTALIAQLLLQQHLPCAPGMGEAG